MILKVIIFLLVMSFVYTLIAIYIECTEQNKNEYSDFELFIRVVRKLLFDFDTFKRFFLVLRKSQSKKVLLNIIENTENEENFLLEKKIEAFKKLEFIQENSLKVEIENYEFSLPSSKLKNSPLKKIKFLEENKEIILEMSSFKIKEYLEMTKDFKKTELEIHLENLDRISFSEESFSITRKNKLKKINKNTIEKIINFSNNISEGELKYG